MTDYQEQIFTKYAATKPTDKEYILIEDGNKAHGIQNLDMRRYKNSPNIISLDDWLLFPPDFNIIENIWRLLKQRLKSQGAILQIEDLKAVLQAEWEKVTPEVIQSLIVSMPERMMEVWKKKGLATKFSSLLLYF